MDGKLEGNSGYLVYIYYDKLQNKIMIYNGPGEALEMTEEQVIQNIHNIMELLTPDYFAVGIYYLSKSIPTRKVLKFHFYNRE